jgi:hypothetical protein
MVTYGAGIEDEPLLMLVPLRGMSLKRLSMLEKKSLIRKTFSS